MRARDRRLGRRSHDDESLLDVDRRCHEIIWAAAGNRFLTDTLDVLYAQSDRVWHLYLADVADTRHAVDEHEIILDALEGGDADAGRRRSSRPTCAASTTRSEPRSPPGCTRRSPAERHSLTVCQRMRRTSWGRVGRNGRGGGSSRSPRRRRPRADRGARPRHRRRSPTPLRRPAAGRARSRPPQLGSAVETEPAGRHDHHLGACGITDRSHSTPCDFSPGGRAGRCRPRPRRGRAPSGRR